MKKVLLDFTKEELKELISPSFRAKQIYNWVHQRYEFDFNNMQNLPKELRDKLDKEYIAMPLSVLDMQISKDGSKKYLFKLQDGLTIETVLLPMKNEEFDEDGNRLFHTKYTICISSQVGCKIGCAFCFTAKGGFIRNLSAGEIVAQVLYLKKDNNIEQNRRVNIVYMGMGEPLDNIDNVTKAVKIFSDLDGLCISPRRQTISTSGLSKQIKKLGDMDLGVLLAISLHAVDDKIREKLMPINKAYNIESIIEAVREFPIDMRKRVMFEYLVLKDVNDDIASAKKLVKLLSGIKAKVNLIYFNTHEGSEFKRPKEENVEAFCNYLNTHGLLCTVRASKGLDISAACGQLKEKKANEYS